MSVMNHVVQFFDTRRFGPKGTFFSCIKTQILCKNLYHMIHCAQNHPPYLNTCMMHASMNGLLIPSAATQYIYSSTRLALVHVCMCVCVREDANTTAPSTLNDCIWKTQHNVHMQFTEMSIHKADRHLMQCTISLESLLLQLSRVYRN